jgi:hypothetical protein
MNTDHRAMNEQEIPRAVLWQKLRRGEIRAAADAGGLGLLPLGAIEQHGPHLPLDTDSVTAFTVCARAAVSPVPPSGHRLAGERIGKGI